MSVLVIGLSHHTAPLALLEALAATDPTVLAEQVRASDAIGEVVVVSTCNRLEVYAESVTFHGAVAAIGEALGGAAGVMIGELSSHLYVHFEDRAVAHAFSVACGLDSMAVGEAQVLGQLREALRRAQRTGTAGPSLNSLFQQALRVGKRAHAETAIDQVSHSLVEAGLDAAAETLGSLARAHVLVVGAGGMSSLAAATVARRGVGRLTIVNRTEAKAHRLADGLAGSTDAQARPLADLDAAPAEADVVITSTGSLGYLVVASQLEAARRHRADAGPDDTRQVVLDLALPRDVDPEVGDLDGVRLIGLDDLGARLAADAATPTLPEVRAVTDLVTAEV
ncbi:MAG: glutamyl-tRNA reductase, partial [Lapillicoccus sp.]